MDADRVDLGGWELGVTSQGKGEGKLKTIFRTAMEAFFFLPSFLEVWNL